MLFIIIIKPAITLQRYVIEIKNANHAIWNGILQV